MSLMIRRYLMLAAKKVAETFSAWFRSEGWMRSEGW
jgi:hypothetical protein